MNASKWILPVGLFLLLSAWTGAEAGSIYRKAQGRIRPLTADPTARWVGDSVTITINERSVIENETERKMDKDSSRSAKMSGTLDLANIFSSVGKHIFDFPNLDFSSSASAKFDGETEYESDRSMTDEITVTVQDVQPNGNLVVIGTLARSIHGDTQIVQVSGIVRPDDISYENKVSSTRVAQFRIINRMKGQEKNFTNPGWLAGIANFVNPF